MNHHQKLSVHLKANQQIANSLIDYFQRQLKKQQQQLKLTQTYKKQLLEYAKSQSKQIKKVFQQYSNLFNQFQHKSDYIVSITQLIPKLNAVKEQISNLLTTSLGMQKAEIKASNKQKEQNKNKLKKQYLDYLEDHEKTLREVIEFHSRNALVENTRTIETITNLMSKIHQIHLAS